MFFRPKRNYVAKNNKSEIHRVTSSKLANRMDRGGSAAEQKLAEKLVILNNRGLGMLTRIYNIKKACQDPKSRPSFLNDKSLEQALKIIVRKFPVMENSKASHMQPVMQMHMDVVKGLSNYYFTFVDVMIFKDHASELLTSIDASFVHFDISLNFELTKAYFDLITTYACLFVLISKVDDRKAVLSLFNHAHEMQKGHGESNFPRLGQLIIDYEVPFKKLSEEFTPHAQRVGIALSSLNLLYKRRHLGGEQMRQAQILSLTSMPQQMLSPALSETVPCEYLSMETMTKWILFAYTLCPSQITAVSNAGEVWKMCLQDGFCMTLFRDEVLYIHKELQTLFESIKGQNKRTKEVQDCLAHSLQTSANFHRERRKYLITAMDEMIAILSDQPGLLGPKVLVALLGMSHARDEIYWLLRHKYHPPPKGKKIAQDDYEDERLPKLLYCVLELQELFKKYSKVIQRYFIQYLSGFDVALLKTIIQRISVCPEDESLIMTDFVENLSACSVKQIEAGEVPDLRGVRLDWMRLQAYTSIRGSVPELKENRELAVLMNTIILHTKLVDEQEEVVNDVADLSILCFYPSFFEQNFLGCLENSQMMKYAIAYPMTCTHFLNCTHELCPEERHPIGDRSLSAVNSFLETIAFKATHYISQLCEEHLRLTRQLDPGTAVNFHKILEESKSKKDRPRPVPPKPGEESRRKTVEAQKPIDTKYHGQIDLLTAITHCKDLVVWEHVFSPREYLVSHLEEFFSKTINRYNDILLKRLFLNGGAVYSPARLSLITRSKAGYPRVEEYTDLVEMRALAELLGAYGVRHFSRKLVSRIIGEVEELKKMILVNKDVLGYVCEHPLNFDVFDVLKRIKTFDELITRSTNIGILLLFRMLISTGLKDTLPKRVPYLMHVLKDFKGNNTRNESTLTHEMAQAAGIECEFDAELYHALRNSREKNEEDGMIWTLLLSFWALSISAIAFKDSSEYNSVLEAHENNIHCLAYTLNLLPQALFTITGESVQEKIQIFLQIAATGLLKLSTDQSNVSKDMIPKQRGSAYILLDLIVKESSYMTQQELDIYFPYPLIREAYNHVYKKQRVHQFKRGSESQDIDAS
uniref:Nck-associated protein 1-like n=1 Tax=Clytia hemisphaerica TaxID=252671 RepID=A0A7M5XEU7_9CNID